MALAYLHKCRLRTFSRRASFLFTYHRCFLVNVHTYFFKVSCRRYRGVLLCGGCTQSKLRWLTVGCHLTTTASTVTVTQSDMKQHMEEIHHGGPNATSVTCESSHSLLKTRCKSICRKSEGSHFACCLVLRPLSSWMNRHDTHCSWSQIVEQGIVAFLAAVVSFSCLPHNERH